MARPFRKSVGVIGLGIIGRRIADHLRHQGFSVFVWNRSPRAVPSFVGSPAELAQMCNYLQVFVGDDEALGQVIRSAAPSLTPQHIVIVHSTVSPDSVMEVAEVVKRRGARLVEAPFTGSKQAAENGQLVYYLAGDEAARQEVMPLLRASSREIVHVGELGQAAVMKVATNIVTAASVQAAAEAMALVQEAGIPLEKFVEALQENASKSGTLDLKLPRMISGDFETHFSLKHMLKDMQIANLMARKFNLDLSVTAAARDLLLDQTRKGHGEEDYCAIAQRFLRARTPEIESPPTEALPETTAHAIPEPAKIESLAAPAAPETILVQPEAFGTLNEPVRIEALIKLLRGESAREELLQIGPAKEEIAPAEAAPAQEVKAEKEEVTETPMPELLAPVAVRVEPSAAHVKPVAPAAEPVLPAPSPVVAEQSPSVQPVPHEDAAFIELQLARLDAGMPIDPSEPHAGNGGAGHEAEFFAPHANGADRLPATETVSRPAEDLEEATHLHSTPMRNGPPALDPTVLTQNQDEAEEPIGILARLLRKTTDY